MKQRTKSLLIIFSLALAFMATLAFNKYQQKQPSEYSLSLPVEQWNAIITAIERPDDVSNNQKKEISKLITSNLKPVADTTKKK